MSDDPKKYVSYCYLPEGVDAREFSAILADIMINTETHAIAPDEKTLEEVVKPLMLAPKCFRTRIIVEISEDAEDMPNGDPNWKDGI